MRRPTIGRKCWTIIAQHDKISMNIWRSVMTNKRKDDDAALGCVVYAIIGMLLMPVAGLLLVCSKNPEKKTWGWILLVVGVVLWIAASVGSA